MTIIKGHCHCRALSYTLDATPSHLLLTAYCHCTQCQRLNGAPFIWTTHWKKEAVTWSSSSSSSFSPSSSNQMINQLFGSNLTTVDLYESLEAKKFKIRCTKCGTPMGTWNIAKQKWSIYPTAFERPQDDQANPSGFELLTPTSHMFYGSWKAITMSDDLPKYLGYPNESSRVDRNSQPLTSDFGTLDFHPHEPRDLIGYGATPPHPHWPNNARLALSFVLNYEEGGENITLNGDTFSEQYLSEYGAVNGKMPPANVRNLSVESAYEYGSHRGFWRILDLFKRNNLRFTSWAVGRAVELNPGVVKAMEDAGCEVASHSYRWFDHSQMSPQEERVQIEKAINAIRSASSVSREPRGWYTGRQSIHTRKLVYQVYKQLGLHEQLYDSDAYDDDLPYWVAAPDGTKDEYLLVIPYTLDANDMRFAITPGFFNADSFASYLIDAFDTLVKESFLPTSNSCSVPKMMTVGLHCRVIGRPGRFKALEKFIHHVQTTNAKLLQLGSGQGGIWITTREEIANHWRKHHPPPSFPSSSS